MAGQWPVDSGRGRQRLAGRYYFDKNIFMCFSEGLPFDLFNNSELGREFVEGMEGLDASSIRTDAFDTCCKPTC